MSGEGEPENTGVWMWAHILWQKRNLRMEEFADMPRNVQLAYIASEQLAQKVPINAIDRLAKAYIKTSRR